MKRVIWFSFGVAVTVVVVVRGRRMAARYLPAALVDQATVAATDAVDRTARFARNFRSEFETAFADREKELMTALLEERPVSTLRDRRSLDDSAWEDDEDELGFSF